MKSGSAVFGVLFVAIGLGAALFVALAGFERARRGEFERGVAAYEAELRAKAIEASIDVADGAELNVEDPPRAISAEPPSPAFQAPPRLTKVHYYYGDNSRHNRPFREAEDWFPFVCGALAICGFIGFLRTRVARARG